MEILDLTIKNNSFLKKIHRRTKSNFDNYLENNLSKTDKFDTESHPLKTPKTLHKTISSNFDGINKEIVLSADQTNKIISESKQKDLNKKEIFIEKLDLTPEEIIINHKKSDLKNASDIFEFGKKKNIEFKYVKELETSKSSNFEDRMSQIRQKYQITEENENFFVIPEQNNEIDDNLIRKDKSPVDFFQNKGKNLFEKDGFIKKKAIGIEIGNKNEKNMHQKTISLVLTRQNLFKCGNNNQNVINNNNTTNNDTLNIMKTMQNLEKRVFFLENQVITLKNDNIKLVKMNQELEKTFDAFTKENNSAITIAINFEKKMQELEKIMKKTQDSFNNIHKNVKTHIFDEHLLGSLSSEKKTRLIKEKEELQIKTNMNTEENNKKVAIVPLRKSIDSNLTKSSNNFYEKPGGKSDIESNLNEYILKKGGKIMNNLAQKKIFLTPKGVKSIDKTFGNK